MRGRRGTAAWRRSSASGRRRARRCTTRNLAARDRSSSRSPAALRDRARAPPCCWTGCGRPPRRGGRGGAARRRGRGKHRSTASSCRWTAMLASLPAILAALSRDGRRRGRVSRVLRELNNPEPQLPRRAAGPAGRRSPGRVRRPRRATGRCRSSWPTSARPSRSAPWRSPGRCGTRRPGNGRCSSCALSQLPGIGMLYAVAEVPVPLIVTLLNRRRRRSARPAGRA